MRKKIRRYEKCLEVLLYFYFGIPSINLEFTFDGTLDTLHINKRNIHTCIPTKGCEFIIFVAPDTSHLQWTGLGTFLKGRLNQQQKLRKTLKTTKIWCQWFL